MSNRKFGDAKLRGWFGPIFPPGLDVLQQHYAKPSQVHGQDLEHAGRQISCFKEVVQREETNDGYDWFGGLVFETGTAKFVVMFPWAQDVSLADGTQSDRHMAVYIQGTVPISVIDNTLAQLAAELDKISTSKPVSVEA